MPVYPASLFQSGYSLKNSNMAAAATIKAAYATRTPV